MNIKIIFGVIFLLIFCIILISLIIKINKNSKKNITVEPQNKEIIGDKIFFQSNGNKISGFIFKPKGSDLPAILYLHGGTSGVGSNVKACQLLMQKGYVCLAINYPGEQDSEGIKGDNNEEIIAAADALLYLRELKYVDKNNVGVFGTSHGAGITLNLIENYLGKLNGDEIKVAVEGFGGVNAKEICYYWASDLPRKNITKKDCDNMSDEEYVGKSPILRVNKISAPLLIIHGEKDDVVPIEQSYELEKQLISHNKVHKLKTYPHSNHGFIYTNTKEATQARIEILKWFDKYLKQ